MQLIDIENVDGYLLRQRGFNLCNYSAYSINTIALYLGEMPRLKPLGIELLAIVIVINGIFCFFSGIDSLVFSSFLKSSLPINTTVLRFGESTATFVATWGSILLVIGIMSFIAAYGLFTGARWGWDASFALALVGIVIPIVNIFSGYWPSIFTLMLSSVIMIYLLRRDVRAYFRRAVPSHSGAEAA